MTLLFITTDIKKDEFVSFWKIVEMVLIVPELVKQKCRISIRWYET